jgi:hypothetical protein
MLGIMKLYIQRSGVWIVPSIPSATTNRKKMTESIIATIMATNSTENISGFMSSDNDVYLYNVITN